MPLPRRLDPSAPRLCPACLGHGERLTPPIPRAILDDPGARSERLLAWADESRPKHVPCPECQGAGAIRGAA